MNWTAFAFLFRLSSNSTSLLRSSIQTCSIIAIVFGMQLITVAASIPLSEFSPYNALIFDDFTASGSDVEGNAAIGRRLTTTDYSFGAALDPGSTADQAVVTLIGTVAMERTRIYYGDFVHVGGGRFSNSTVDGRIRNETSLAFSALQTEYQELSDTLSNLAPTGTVTSEFNRLSLSGTDAFNVFNIAPSAWTDAAGGDITVIDIDIPTGATAIINVEGTTPELNAMGFDKANGSEPAAHRHQTLFNFFEAETVTTRNIGLEGALLAPRAELLHQDAVIYGQVVARSFEGNGQIDLEPFSGQLSAVVPEPVAAQYSLWLFGIGGLTLGVRRQRRHG